MSTRKYALHSVCPQLSVPLFFSRFSFPFLVFQASEVVAQYREDLYKENMALPEAAEAFIHVVKAFRHTDKKAILEILKDPDNFYYV